MNSSMEDRSASPDGLKFAPHQVGKAKSHEINGLSSAKAWERARRGVKSVIDGPNTDIDQMIRVVLANGHVTIELKEVFPLLARRQFAQRVEAAVRAALGPDRHVGPVQP